jgi:ABC-type transport system involved in multi-copper enzyme maturation permease subunit
MNSRPSIARLTLVELRKMTDTRAGFWLQLAVVLLTLAVVAIVLAVGETRDQTFEMLFVLAVQPANLLLPIIGILLVTSEWSQRTGMVTFALVPRRGRVIAAKFLAGLTLALGAIVACLAVSAVGAAVAGSAWTMTGAMFGQTMLSVAISMLLGLALGAALLASAPAIVGNFLLPIGVAGLAIIPFLRPVLEWLDIASTTTQLGEQGMSGEEWAQLGTAFAAWFVVLMAVGVARITRGEVR